MKDRRNRLGLLVSLTPLGYLLIAVATVLAVSRSGMYPGGADAYYHIYKGGVVYSALSRGSLWPAYDPLWLGGVEPLRSWAPLPPYLLALCRWIAGGDPVNGYLVLVGLLYFASAMGWFYAGLRLRRPWLGAFLGAVWFFLPANLVTLFGEGDIPRALGMALLPLLLYRICAYAGDRRWVHLPWIMGLMAVVTLCHPGCAGMILLSLLPLAVLYAMVVRGKGIISPVAVSLVLGILAAGLWLLPALTGGLLSVDSSEHMTRFFQSLWVTLNPLYRLEHGAYDYYFGLAACVLAAFGLLCAPREAVPGFGAGLAILLCTSDSMRLVLSVLPGGRYLWMLRFLPVALGLVLMSLLRWRRLRPWLTVALCLLLAADALPSLPLVYGAHSGKSAGQTMSEYYEWTLVGEAQEITQQRLALVDENILDSMSVYLVTGDGQPVAGLYGAPQQTSAIRANVSQVSLALEEGAYPYLFDRCLELGSDTVLIRTSLVKNPESAPVTQMDDAAEAAGYSLWDCNDLYRLYHLDAPEHWGTVSKYHAIGIGSTAASISLYFPNVEETASINLSDYSYEELSQYDLVFLSGFTYDDREAAEALVLKLSENGVRVVILADGIPEDRATRNQSFLGVLCNPITFSNGYPEMDTIDGKINADLFPQGHTEWRTVYLSGLTERWGYIYDSGLELDIYGTVKNDNIILIGANLAYFYGLTHDASVGRLLSHAMEEELGELPERRLVPLTVDVTGNRITVESPEDGVNACLAWHDGFSCDRPIYARNHLTFVPQGVSHISVGCPGLPAGAAVSAAALLVAAWYFRWMRKRERELLSEAKAPEAEDASGADESPEDA